MSIGCSSGFKSKIHLANVKSISQQPHLLSDTVTKLSLFAIHTYKIYQILIEKQDLTHIYPKFIRQ